MKANRFQFRGKEPESLLATLEILADRELAPRLLRLSKSIDHDVAAGRLLTTAAVFEDCASTRQET
jgi:hypothetical protein